MTALEANAAEQTPFTSIFLASKQHILATYRELALLRQCAATLTAEPERRISIVTPPWDKHIHFIRNTLIHMGVSCSQMNFSTVHEDADKEQGIWLELH